MRIPHPNVVTIRLWQTWTLQRLIGMHGSQSTGRSLTRPLLSQCLANQLKLTPILVRCKSVDGPMAMARQAIRSLRFSCASTTRRNGLMQAITSKRTKRRARKCSHGHSGNMKWTRAKFSLMALLESNAEPLVVMERCKTLRLRTCTTCVASWTMLVTYYTSKLNNEWWDCDMTVNWLQLISSSSKYHFFLSI